MATDYKHRIPAYRDQDTKRRPRRWLLPAIGGAALVVAAGGLIYGAIVLVEKLKAPVGDAPAATAAPLPTTASSGWPASWLGEAPEPRLTVFKAQPDEEQILAEAEIRTRLREENEGRKEPGAHYYYLNAGAYPAQKDAEQLKSRLGGVQIKAAKLELMRDPGAAPNTDWFRVKIGPYGTVNDAELVRQYLRTHGIDTVVQVPLDGR